MSPTEILIIMFGGLSLFLLAGLPVAFVLGGLSVLFTVVFWDSSALVVLVLQMFDTMHSEALLGIPLYIFMAMLLQRSDIIRDLYNAMELWFGRVRGGLAIGTVVICLVMAAMTGVVGAAVTAMGILALPEMLKRGYDPRLATGTICASGTLGILIPPSVLTIVYSVTAQVSIGKMLIAGIVPGLLLGLLYIGYILVIGYLRPEMIPDREDIRPSSWGQKFAALKTLILPSMIIIMVLGSIFFGVATPTEAAAVGVLGAAIAALLRGNLNRGMLYDCAVGTLKTTGMILWITLGAKAYVAIFTGLGGADTLFQLLEGLDANPYVVLALMMLILIFLGTVLDEIGIILLTVPVFLPVVQFYGFDQIWFGVLFALTIQMGYISPPFGYTLFYIKGTLPKDISMGTVYRGILPFFLLQIAGLLVCVALPDLITWLPELMR
ncbi:TRAP transporter large permease [Pseudorhizobium pelagicum]|uniref:TRAP transporter large permease protein n=1 Tax=Pseudorhizobium pelagicum TaxID=1509405 RepID=A0A922T8R7_9HYPH|nr:TRAP transporter large permease subunit [Pseudorhizobium pelagicum]KEQ03265.1 TRAP dicarboxylate transporter subunit DctM [Pseudorhizobium pelagicum]KEQ05166.1 TRAP dicarboxylate transporter subunit DctM [Pseudorhizobium pelagicum]